jgi:putative phosphoribosyl transferase
MDAVIIDNPKFRNKSFVFEDRKDAGYYLALTLEKFAKKDAVVLAIPSGGVPIGLAIASHLELSFDLLIIRKIPIPGNPEAGLGAMSLEGDVILNESIIDMLRLSKDDIENLAASVMAELRARNQVFRGGKSLIEIKSKTVILADDGLASGYTMKAAARMIRKKGPKEIVVAVPTASIDAVKLLSKEVDAIFCPNIRGGDRFAVAEAYRNWHDLTREDVLIDIMRHGLLSGD